MKSDIVKLIFKTQKQILNYINKRILELNITDFNPANGWMIMHIASHNDEPQNMVSLAKYFCKSKANISIVAKRLIKNGYLKKSQSTDNKKNIYLELTSKGFKLNQSIKVILKDIKVEIENIFTVEELDLFYVLISRLCDHISDNMLRKNNIINPVLSEFAAIA